MGSPNCVGMPENVKDVFELLYIQYYNLAISWKAFCQLYCSSEENAELRNRFGVRFFRQIHNILIKIIILEICKISEDAENKNHRNLCISRLVQEVKANRCDFDDLGLTEKCVTLKNQREKFRKSRNRFIAHHSWIDRTAPLSDVKLEMIDRILDLQFSIINDVYKLYIGCDLDNYYKGLGREKGDAEELLDGLRNLALRLDGERPGLGES